MKKNRKKNGKNFTLIEENTFLGAMIAPQKCLEYTMISMTNMTQKSKKDMLDKALWTDIT